MNAILYVRRMYAAIALRLIPQKELIGTARAAVLAHLKEGHTRVELSELASSLEVSEVTVGLQLGRYAPDLCVRQGWVTTLELAVAEAAIAKGIRTAGSRLRRLNPQVLRTYYERNHTLSPEQLEAAIKAVSSPVTVLTGGPGTGKTTTLKAILGALQTFGYDVALAAPTGRAAERMTEATGHFAQTVHRLLHYSRSRGWLWNLLLPVRRDALVIDEFSMMDTIMAAKLFQATSPYTRVICIGDEEQIPSIGSGAVLRDLIASGTVTVCRLTTTHRQSQESQIVQLAQAMRKGKTVEWIQPGQGKSDVYFIPAPNDHAIASVIGKAMKSLPARLGYTANTDIQVLTAIHASPAGTNNLNKVIRAALLGDAARQPFAVGDRVLHTKNNRRKRVSNGNVGIVTAVSAATLTVAYPTKSLTYTRKEQTELTHAHAMSIYKMQGSEAPVVIIPLSDNQTRYLNRPLLLTAASRPKQLLIFVGSQAAYEAAMSDISPYQRETGLVAELENMS